MTLDIARLIQGNIRPYASYGAFGDSISAGFGLTDLAAATSPAWVYRLGRHLRVVPSNFAISGSMTADQQPFAYRQIVSSTAAQLFTFATGTNEGLFNSPSQVERQDTFAALHAASLAWLAIPEGSKCRGQRRARTLSIATLTSDGAGGLNTRATATTSTPHGLADGAPVRIAGADQADYNVLAGITVTSPTAFTIPIANAPASPATGTITATTLDIAYTGSWVDEAAYYDGTMSVRSSTQGAAAQWDTFGDVAYLAYGAQVGDAGAFDVYVDGVKHSSYTSSGPGGGMSETGVHKTRHGSCLVRLAGLGRRRHTIRIVVTSATGAGNVWLDWASIGAVGGAAHLAGPTVLAGGTPITQDVDFGGNVYASRARANVEALASDGLNVAFVDAAAYMAYGTDLSPDKLHPNATGHRRIFEGYKAALDTSATARLRGKASSGINSDIRQLTGLTTPLSPAQGGTGAASLADALVSVPGLAMPWILARWLQYPIHLERHGMVGDFAGTTGTDNGTAWLRALGSGEKLVLSPGRRYMLGEVDPIVNRALYIEGEVGSGLVFTKAGLDVQHNDYLTPLSLNRFSLLTLSQEQGAGVKITMPEPDGTRSLNRPNVFLDLLDIGGVQQVNSGFLYGLHLVNAQTVQGRKLRILGRQDVTLTTMARFTKMRAGIYSQHTGPQIGGAPRMDNVYVQSAQSGVEITGRAEGGYFITPMIEAVVVGIANLMVDTRPGFEVRGGHINATRFILQLVNTPNFSVGGIQAYKFDKANVALDDPGNLPRGIVDAGETVGILVDTCNTGTIDPNVFNVGAFNTVDTSGAYTAIRMLDCYGITVLPQRMLYGTRGVSLMGVSQSNDIARPEIVQPVESASRPYRPFANDSTGQKTNNYRGGGLRLKEASNSAAYTTGAPGYPVTLPSIDVEVGYRLRVEASVTGTGSTGGTYLAFLQKTTGTATGTWITGGTVLTQSSGTIPASGRVDFAWSGEFVVTGKGSLQLAMNMAGPSATIAAGNAQMSVSLI